MIDSYEKHISCTFRSSDILAKIHYQDTYTNIKTNREARLIMRDRSLDDLASLLRKFADEREWNSSILQRIWQWPLLLRQPNC